MNKYQIIEKILKEKLKENNELTEEQWDAFARQKCLLSSFTLQAHEDVMNWEELKHSIKHPNKKLEKQIEKIRKKLHQAVTRYGLSSIETRKLNAQIHEWILLYQRNKDSSAFLKQRFYTKDQFFYQIYQKSYQQLKEVTKQNKKFPATKQWNQYAYQNQLLSNISIQFISGENWNQLRKKILRELNNDNT